MFYLELLIVATPYSRTFVLFLFFLPGSSYLHITSTD